MLNFIQNFFLSIYINNIIIKYINNILIIYYIKRKIFLEKFPKIFFFKSWQNNILSRWWDSNSRPPAYKAGAITTMLHRQLIQINNASMAEWSKALRSGRSFFGSVGSNPTGCIMICQQMRPWRNWQRVGFQTRRLGVRVPLASDIFLNINSLCKQGEKCFCSNNTVLFFSVHSLAVIDVHFITSIRNEHMSITCFKSNLIEFQWFWNEHFFLEFIIIIISWIYIKIITNM